MHLRELYVPVAVFIPHERIDGIRDVVEPVVGKPFCHFGLGALQFADDPAIDERQLQRKAFVQSAIVPFGVHQHKAGRVPQFVAEVSIALATLDVEVDRAAERG